MSDTVFMRLSGPVTRWRMFVVKLTISTLIVLFAAITNTLTGKEWASMTPTQKLVSVCAIATLVCRNIESHMDTSFSAGQDAAKQVNP